ncbi:unnamed protein product [Brugia timori]|uniref:MADF domain-containing protein n=1 Tax=Brugia timori TaxID=42155 RepID=A0A0R3R7E6_9BILA|nr:unnamed protein product [Brugia timori]
MSNETIVWTDAMREVLIKSVQRQECIWNFSNVDYRNAAKKRQIFWEIAQEMSEMFGIMLKDIKTEMSDDDDDNDNADDVLIAIITLLNNFESTHTSRQWQHLRDQYRRAKRRMEVSNVQIKPWRFMQMLKFTDATDIAEANDPMTRIMVM